MPTTTELFLLAMILIFSVPYLVWRLGRTDYWAPLVVVQIVGGILLGPGVLGRVFPDYYAFVFRPEVIAPLNGIAWWGVMIFVWLAGIELDLREAWAKRGETGVTAGLALGVPLLFGSAAAWVLLRSPGWAGPEAREWQAVLGIGMACAVTALPILILLDWERVGRQAAFLGAFAVAAWAVRRLVARVPEDDRWYIGLIWLAVAGFASDWAGLHYMVGAFLAGAVLDAGWFNRERLDFFRNAILLSVMPVFFLSTGLRTRWDLGGVAVFGAAALLLAASVGGKLAGVHLAGRVLRWRPGEASVIGWLLQTKALIMIIFANILLDRAVITNVTFTALLLMAVASTTLTIPVVTPKLRRAAELIGKA